MMSSPKICSVKSVIPTAPPEPGVTSEFQPAATGVKSQQAALARLASLAVLVAPDPQEKGEHQEHQETAELQAPLDLLAPQVMPAAAEAATAAADPLDLQDLLEPPAHLVPMAIPELMAPQAMPEPRDPQEKQEQPVPQDKPVAKDPLANPALTPLRLPPALQDPRDLLASVAQLDLPVPQVLKDSPVVEDHLASEVREETVVLTVVQVAKVMQVRQDPVAMMPNTAHVAAAVACAVKYYF
jgi:hypothetical protein